MARLKKLGAFLLLTLTVYACGACDSAITKDNLNTAGAYNTSLGTGIELFIQKSEVDDLLGAPTDLQNNIYTYLTGTDSISVEYEDGLVVTIFITETHWVTVNGFGPGKEYTQDDIEQALGKNMNQNADNGTLLYYFDKRNRPIEEPEKALYFTSFIIYNDNTFDHILIRSAEYANGLSQ